MAALIPNIAKGKFARYAMLPLANDALIWTVLRSSGLGSDATLRDDDDLATVLTHGTEVSGAGYARQTATGVTVTIDDTNDRVDVDAADPTFTLTAAQPTGKIVLCYDDDTTGGTDSSQIPVFMDDFAVTVDGSASYIVAASGFGRAA